MFPLLLTLLLVHFLVLALHDIVPMGRWTDFERLRVDNSPRRRYLSALVNGAFGFAPLYFVYRALTASAGASRHHDLLTAIWFLLGLLVGEVLSWWRFYLFGATPETAERLGRITQGTYTFLPARNGLTVNAFHCVLHALTLVCLGVTNFMLRA